ncbi:hypothetical protein DFJ58DRAFT_770651 [Suillus subalutaceus]|uniref:uncharacterized protein n=1 Tax=Suillus subalutaceus TaxID=48586 RepID=UPI001B87A1DD|nr:uncharacterized protein DFJ58DRAFT_770651 [Suillus subalutaceus]KAG1865887.1 hypothetical protein DFJ58DRAFT_770651 [Suillus subalutaceus]
MDSISESNNKVIFCRGSQDKGHCVECGHGRSKHPRKVLDYRPEDTIQDEPQPSSSATIKEIFDRVAGGRSINDKPSATRRGSLSLTAAWDEAISTLSSTRLAGYNKLAKGLVPSAGLRKDRKETNPYPPSQVHRNTASNSATAATATVFRVASIAMLICGFDKSGLIREAKAPGKGGQNEIQAMRNRGCYLDQQFRIDSGWSYAKITNNLCTWFPKVFRYLDTQVEKRTSQPQSSHEEKPVWRLLNKSGQVLTVVDVAFPTGSDLSKHKGRDKASASECHLWFVTRNRIPDDIYESWNTQPVIAGSDSECDESDQLFSDTDGSVADKSDNELASSLMELDLTDVKVKDSNPKGKMKARTPKRTNHMKRVLSPDESSSDTKRRVVQKKHKKESASDVPLFFSDSGSSSCQAPPPTQPQFSSLRHGDLRLKVSSPPEFVSVSEDDVLWRNRTDGDDPFAPERINPWDSRYIMMQNAANFLI